MASKAAKKEVTSPSIGVMHHDVLDELSRAAEEGRLPKAILISGPAGIGKRALAKVLARRILGFADDAPAASDLVEASPDETGKTRAIKVDEIRRLTAALRLTSDTGRRVALIPDADLMNEAASNALLKSLEEPPAGGWMILTAAAPWLLPATVRSRLAIVSLPLPEADAALAAVEEVSPEADLEEITSVLAIAGGSPGAALKMQTDGSWKHAEGIAAIAKAAASEKFDRKKAMKFAEGVGEAGFETASTLFLRFLHLAGLKAAGADGAASPDEAGGIAAFAKKASLARIAEAYRAAAEFKAAAEKQHLGKAWNMYRMCLLLEWSCK